VSRGRFDGDGGHVAGAWTGGLHGVGKAGTNDARVPGIAEEQFLALAEAAKKSCPFSKALAATEITLEAKLSS